MSRSFAVAVLFLLALRVPDAPAQSPGTISVSAKVGGKTHTANGSGSCRHTPAASIYDVPAALYMAEYAGSKDGGITSMRLTLWRPKDGSREQLSLSLRTSSSSHRIQSGGRGEQVGSGKVSLIPVGSGGNFEIKGKDEKGTALEVVIKCPAFAGVEAEGG